MSYGTYTGLTELILVLRNLYCNSDTEVPIGTTEYFYWYKSTRRYYRTDSLYGGTHRYHWTYTYFTDTIVPIGTIELIQIQDLSDTGVPVGTTEQIRYGQNLTKCRSTRRYYRTDQIQDITYSDTGLIRYRSTRRYYRTYTETELIRYRTYRIQEYP